jgi:5,10-methylenetetrahydromethanopterin reductase
LFEPYKISFGLGGLSLDKTEIIQEKIESAGFRGVWFSENNVSEAFTQIAAICRSAKKLRYGTSIVGVYGRTPLIMAMGAASLANISRGRFVLGLGTQTRKSNEFWYGGVDFFEPQQMITEYAQIVRGLLDGKRVTFKGKILKAEDLELISKPKYPTKIFIAAIGPKMLQVAGEIADGVIGGFWTPKFIEDIVLPNLKKGAEKAGRSLSEFEILCTQDVLPLDENDIHNGIEAMKPQILMAATVSFFEKIFVHAGFQRELVQIKEFMAKGEIDAAIASVSDEMVQELEIVGQRNEIRARVGQLVKAGLTEVIIQPNPGNLFYPLHPKHLPTSVSNFARKPLYSDAEQLYHKVILALS